MNYLNREYSEQKVTRQVGIKAVNTEYIEQLKRALTEAEDNYHLGIFKEVVKPVLIRYKWRIIWGMGSVGFKNFHGDHLDNETIDRLFYDIEQYSVSDSQCTMLWNVMCSIQSNNDGSSSGWCPGIDELGVDATPHELAEWFCTTLNPGLSDD